MQVDYVFTNPDELTKENMNYREHQVKVANVTMTEEKMVIHFTYLGPATLNEKE